jgi:hypothetical protein
MGLRVRAVWLPDEELAPTVESIRWFEPSGEPDAAYETYEAHLRPGRLLSSRSRSCRMCGAILRARRLSLFSL